MDLVDYARTYDRLLEDRLKASRVDFGDDCRNAYPGTCHTLALSA